MELVHAIAAPGTAVLAGRAVGSTSPRARRPLYVMERGRIMLAEPAQVAPRADPDRLAAAYLGARSTPRRSTPDGHRQSARRPCCRASSSGSRTACSAVGLVLIYKVSRFINFAQGALGAFGGALVGTLVVTYGVPYWVGLRHRHRVRRRPGRRHRGRHRAAAGRPAAPAWASSSPCCWPVPAGRVLRHQHRRADRQPLPLSRRASPISRSATSSWSPSYTALLILSPLVVIAVLVLLKWTRSAPRSAPPPANPDTAYGGHLAQEDRRPHLGAGRRHRRVQRDPALADPGRRRPRCPRAVAHAPRPGRGGHRPLRAHRRRVRRRHRRRAARHDRPIAGRHERRRRRDPHRDRARRPPGPPAQGRPRRPSPTATGPRCSIRPLHEAYPLSCGSGGTSADVMTAFMFVAVAVAGGGVVQQRRRFGMTPRHGVRHGGAVGLC